MPEEATTGEDTTMNTTTVESIMAMNVFMGDVIIEDDPMFDGVTHTVFVKDSYTVPGIAGEYGTRYFYTVPMDEDGNLDNENGAWSDGIATWVMLTIVSGRN